MLLRFQVLGHGPRGLVEMKHRPDRENHNHDQQRIAEGLRTEGRLKQVTQNPRALWAQAETNDIDHKEQDR